ncbi:hypothetical protein LVISKB_2033 [Levilactobacillus brevis KB290]|uniref:Uncharacterized protein n=1 Tax=Levilactobacillus brevis KB290 TaxID=1001583 RepID=M5AFU1_LEVBR|nr:hypothetical protein LVISKB_2033 [Levilactobacillus brevis KB290]
MGLKKAVSQRPNFIYLIKFTQQPVTAEKPRSIPQ